MEKTVSTLDWKPVTTAPADADLELSIYDNGEYHSLVFPCRRDGSGWRDVVPIVLCPIVLCPIVLCHSFQLTGGVGMVRAGSNRN